MTSTNNQYVVRNRWIAGIATVFVLLLAVWLIFNPSYTVTVPVDKVQEMVNSKLPITGEKLAGIAGYSINEVTVGFRRDGKINIDATVMGRFNSHTGHFKVSGAGEPFYKDGSFYIHDVKFGPVETLSFETVQKTPGPVGIISNAIAKKLGIQEELKAWYEQNKSSIQSKIREASVSVLQSTLEKHPVYTLKDDVKGTVAKFALESVTVQQDTLLVKLSPLQAVFKILMWCVIIVVVVAVALCIIFASEGSGFALLLW